MLSYLSFILFSGLSDRPSKIATGTPRKWCILLYSGIVRHGGRLDRAADLWPVGVGSSIHWGSHCLRILCKSFTHNCSWQSIYGLLYYSLCTCELGIRVTSNAVVLYRAAALNFLRLKPLGKFCLGSRTTIDIIMVGCIIVCALRPCLRTTRHMAADHWLSADLRFRTAAIESFKRVLRGCLVNEEMKHPSSWTEIWLIIYIVYIKYSNILYFCCF